jgi:hypothetical protein
MSKMGAPGSRRPPSTRRTYAPTNLEPRSDGVNTATGKRESRCQHDDLHHHAGVSVGRAKPTNHHLGLNLDTHENLLSLLQSNVSPGQFDLSQTDNYLATRSKTITKSIAMSVQTMTSIVVCFNINRNRRMDVLPDEGRESKSILPRKTGLFKIAQFKVRRTFASPSFTDAQDKNRESEHIPMTTKTLATVIRGVTW